MMFSRVSDFDKAIKKNWAYPVVDGIIDIQLYNKAKYRILWILKEPNKSGDEAAEWNHREFHRKGTIDYNKWFITYKKIHYVSYGVLNGISCWDDMEDIDMETARIEGVNALQHVAIININKSGGGAVSNQNKINQLYEEKKDLLLKQIDGINPEIIINGSRCDALFNDLSVNNKIKKMKNSELRYSVTPERLIIDYYHPAVRTKGITEEKYCDDIFNVAKLWTGR